MADRGQHPAPSIPDLLNAAAEELAQLTVLDLDQDYELIADITGQSFVGSVREARSASSRSVMSIL